MYRTRNRISKILAGAAAGVLSFTAVMLAMPLPAQAQAAPSGNVQATLQQYADQLHAAGVSGVLTELVKPNGDSVKARAGTGNRQTGEPVPWQAHFRTGSTTKTFVSTVVLQLAAEHKLSLNDSVHKWLPGLFQGTGYDGSKITIRHLLQHTSGVFDLSLIHI